MSSLRQLGFCRRRAVPFGRAPKKIWSQPSISHSKCRIACSKQLTNPPKEPSQPEAGVSRLYAARAVSRMPNIIQRQASALRSGATVLSSPDLVGDRRPGGGRALALRGQVADGLRVLEVGGVGAGAFHQGLRSLLGGLLPRARRRALAAGPPAPSFKAVPCKLPLTILKQNPKESPTISRYDCA